MPASSRKSKKTESKARTSAKAKASRTKQPGTKAPKATKALKAQVAPSRRRRKAGEKKSHIGAASPGRPTTFTEEIAAEICERVMMREPIRQICLLAHMPEERTVYGWLARKPEFAQNYARAKEIQMDAFAEELVEIADDSRNDWVERENARGEKKVIFNKDATMRAKLRIATRQWQMSKFAVKKYGDKIDVNMKGQVDSSVTIPETVRLSLIERRRAAQEADEDEDGAMEDGKSTMEDGDAPAEGATGL